MLCNLDIQRWRSGASEIFYTIIALLASCSSEGLGDSELNNVCLMFMDNFHVSILDLYL